MSIKLSSGKEIPVEMHKARMVQKIWLSPVEERLKAIEEAGYNTFLLKTKDMFLDMLTDSGTNAMSDNQIFCTIRALCISTGISLPEDNFMDITQTS